MKKILIQSIKNKRIFFAFLLLLILILIFCVNVVSAVDNDTIYVAKNGSDANDGFSWNTPKLTIKNATETVNANGTVHIANGQYTGVNNTNISLNKNMVIIGESQTRTIINGENINWIFRVDSRVNVLIQNLTLENGIGFIKSGGAIHNYGGNCTVINCNFNGSAVTEMGGAIFNIMGNLNITQCTFTNNNATWGGAILTYYYSTCTVTSCNFIDNNAIYGGAINNNLYSYCAVTDCNFISNNATDYGGAIVNSDYSSTCNLTVKNSNFENNIANIRGGTIYNRGNCEIHFNRIVGNTANNGTAIYCYNGTMDAEYNWWGSNTNPQIIPNLIAINNTGSVDVDPWIILSINAAPTSINNSGTSTITADFNHYVNSTGYIGTLTDHIPEGPITLNIPWGSFIDSITPHEITLNTVNGAITALFYANQGIAPLNPVRITATADGYTTNDTESAYITVNKVSSGNYIPNNGVRTPITVNSTIEVNAATVKMQETGLPINYLILAVLMVIGGFFSITKRD